MRPSASSSAALPGHDPLLLGDMQAAVERIRAAVANGTRICVHGDYDVDGICATALAVLFLRELGADVELASAEQVRGGVRRLARDAGSPRRRRCRPSSDRRLRDHGGRGGRRGAAARARRRRHRPPPTRRDTLPDCPIVATRPSSYPFPELCGTGVVYKLGEALLGADHPTVRRNLDLVALATIADVVPLVDENRALAAAGLRALAATRRPGLQALMRSAGVDPAAVDSGAVGFRLAPRINAAGRLGRPDVALELVLTDDADEARRHAETLEELNRDRQAVEERILREAIAAVDAMPEPRRTTAWLRPVERGLARGRDRHRGVASRRALPPTRRPHHALSRRVEGLGPVDRLLRPPRGALRLLGEPRTLRRSSGGGRSLDRGVEDRGVRGRLRSARRRPSRRRRSLRDRQRRRGRSPRRTSLSDSQRSSRASRRSASAIRSPRCSSLRRRPSHPRRSVTGSTFGSACDSTAATPGARSRSARARRSTGSEPQAASTSPLGSRRTTGTARSRRSSSCGGCSTPPRATRSSACGSPSVWRRGESAWTPEARRIFGELALQEESGRRRQLLESESFRALLLDPALPRAA